MFSRSLFRTNPAAVVILLSAGLVIYLCVVHSPVFDEVAHLPAGCLILEYGRFDLYKTNPPLVKTLAALPVASLAPHYDWTHYQPAAGIRSEWSVGRDFIAANGYQSFRLFMLARFAVLLLWFVGGIVVAAWATELGGKASGLAACTLWCFSPDVMAWSATICPDSPAASMGILCVWYFRKWLAKLTLRAATIVGVFIGLALLTKTSWLVIGIVFPVLTLLHSHSRSIRAVVHLGWMATIAIAVVNCGYTFERSFTRLGDFSFFSAILAQRKEDGALRVRLPDQAHNRFAGTFVEAVRVPLPASFVEGIDLQLHDFDRRRWSYLRGQHKFGGWWYWYIYALLVKTPTGILVLGMIAGIRGGIAMTMNHLTGHLPDGMGPGASSTLSAAAAPCAGGCNLLSPAPVCARLHENAILLLPALAVFAAVSSCTGFSRYMRYILPCYPFVFVWTSASFGTACICSLWLKRICWALLISSVLSSLSAYPHCMSYFNEMAGGPANGPYHLIDANVDWGQDVLALADWLQLQSDDIPTYLSVYSSFDPAVCGIWYHRLPADPRASNGRSGRTPEGLAPGWYVVSVNELFRQDRRFAYLLDFPIHEMIGYSIYVFRLTEPQIREWNRSRGYSADE